ncbi:MAG: 2-C-methyl-D-erythritol 4-phosphate cytidylyltransferase [Gammaproteobacteria bacterium]|nr:2-C-methyl-D-erythritol 4-phosphate cytidylyltransferase [Gammaproteobacteria bacterium]
MSSTISNWAVIPAAGSGSRMATDVPKQYLQINGKTILEHTIERLLGHPKIDGIVVAIAADDERWDSLQIKSNKPIIKTLGGKERCHSVKNALYELTRHGKDRDWVLVHDAARPCLRHADLDKLFAQLSDHMVGGLLAYPVKDTMKRSDEKQRVIETVDRNRLWHALTPQMFRLHLLRDALNNAISDGFLVTDEASAVEHAGYQPKLVEGRADNIKITTPEDLALAEFYLSRLGNQKSGNQ